MKLSSLKVGDKGKVISICCSGELKNHLAELGFIKNVEVEVLLTAPLGEPTMYKVNDEFLSLRANEANYIEVEKIETGKCCNTHETCLYKSFCNKCKRGQQTTKGYINVALIGNPNCGKTTIFNALTCRNERVGNYAGVTVNIVEGTLFFKNYTINIVDLPGINSLNIFNEEEKITKDYILKNKNNFIAINIIDTTHLKKNLLLTTQLVDLNLDVICVLNMFDKFQNRGNDIDVDILSSCLNIKCIPTIAEKEYGLNELLNQIIKKHEERINLSSTTTTNLINNDDNIVFRAEAKEGSLAFLNNTSAEERFRHINDVLEQASFTPGKSKDRNITKVLDSVLLNKKLSLIFFFLPIVIMFQITFSLGGKLSTCLSDILNRASIFLTSFMSTSVIKDIIVNGFIPGIEAVIVFVPQLFILYFFLFILEDSGCMNRLVFIIDKTMQKIGLSGPSFIPLAISFGCNVPGILATKTIKDKKNKIITCLLIPMISCPAKLPIYVLLSSLFFDGTKQVIIILSLYILGILVAIMCSKLLHFCIKNESKDTLIIEFPEYKMPNMFKAAAHSFYNVKHFIKRIGVIVSFASIMLWGLEYFPQRNRDNISESYIAHIGKKIEPILKHNGFNWEINVSLIGGIIAKEIIAPILTILYKKDVKDSKEDIKANMIKDGITIPAILSLLIFILLFSPCIGTLLAIRKEMGIEWMFISLLLNTLLAYLLSLLVFNISSFFYAT